MNERRRPNGIPLPSLGQVLLTVVVVCACQMLWVEFHRQPAATASSPGQEDDPVERIQSIEALVGEGPAAMPELIELLSSAQPKVRAVALYGLGRLKQIDSLPAVRECLADEDAEVRRSALGVFGWICEERDEVLAVAAKMIGDPSAAPRSLAAQMLDSYGTDSIPQTIELLHSANGDIRIAAIDLLAKIDRRRHDPSEVNALLRGMLDDDDPLVRTSAVEAVVMRGAASVDEVGAWLGEENPRVVNAAYRAVYALGDEAVRLLPLLQERMANFDSQLPDQIPVLRVLKTAARPAVPALLRLLPSLGPTTKTDAIETLRIIGADPAELEGLLNPLLSDGDSLARLAAGRLLVQINPDQALRKVAIVVRELEFRENTMTGRDLDVLLGLGAKAQSALPLLIRLLAHQRADVVDQALLVLREIGAAAAPAAPAVQSMLLHADPRDRRTGLLVQALGGIGPAAAPAVPNLLEVLNHPRENSIHRPMQAAQGLDQQLDVLWALGRIGDESPVVLTALRKHLNIGPQHARMFPLETVMLRRAALESLSKLSPDAAGLLDDAIPLLEDPTGSIRMQAALAIAAAPGDRNRAIDPLSAALFDRDSFVRTAAALALRAIGPAAERSAPALAKAACDTRNRVPNFFIVALRKAPDDLAIWGDDLGELSVTAAARSALEAVSTRSAVEGF
jgi:HEAT repeat protein